MYGIFVCDCLCNYCFYDFVLTTRQFMSTLRNLINYLGSCARSPGQPTITFHIGDNV